MLPLQADLSEIAGFRKEALFLLYRKFRPVVLWKKNTLIFEGNENKNGSD